MNKAGPAENGKRELRIGDRDSEVIIFTFVKGFGRYGVGREELQEPEPWKTI